nr:glycosyltransferase family 2 protein [Micromonospora sp. DSM 115978]
MAVLVPAWNEGMVIGSTIDRLLSLDYPRDAIRVYVVDDASTDDTPDVIRRKSAEYPGRVVHVRREVGGQGKAHALNDAIATILDDDWMQALLITDADVIYARDSLRRMTRHLVDPQVGAVTGFICEGSRPGNYMNRFIAYEYVTAQAAARRAQNVVGAMACLAGGMQLHSRENVEAIGGRIDTTSLAEDTFTTFGTQLHGRRAIFDGNAVCYAEEPHSIVGLWKQRLRWARGNVQVTFRFRRLWFRPSRQHKLGRIDFGLIWFVTFLQPVLMIVASAALVALFFSNFDTAWNAFRYLWIAIGLSFMFMTAVALLIEPGVARR